jgi:hypothetical protein
MRLNDVHNRSTWCWNRSRVNISSCRTALSRSRLPTWGKCSLLVGESSQASGLAHARKLCSSHVSWYQSRHAAWFELGKTEHCLGGKSSEVRHEGIGRRTPHSLLLSLRSILQYCTFCTLPHIRSCQPIYHLPAATERSLPDPVKPAQLYQADPCISVYPWSPVCRCCSTVFEWLVARGPRQGPRQGTERHAARLSYCKTFGCVSR